MKNQIKFLFMLIWSTILFTECTKEETANKNLFSEKNNSAAVALDWYKLQLKFLLERNSSFNGAHFGYLGIGLYESVRNGIKNSVSLSTKLYQMPPMPAIENNGYDWQVSANAAMASLIKSFNSGLTAANLASIDSLENAYNAKANPSANSAVFTRSQSYGRSIATAVFEWSKTDNFNPSNTGYVPLVFPGSWVPTPPSFANPVNPYISSARPFLQANVENFAPPVIYTHDSIPSSDFYKMVKNVYDVFQILTVDQKNTALYWVDQGNGVGYTPPGHDFNIIIQALDQKGSNLATAAEVLAKAGIAERDATISCFKSKYKYNLLRPVTFIKKFIDPNWLPYIPTPPHPEYPAAHALITGAALHAAAVVLGQNTQVIDRTYEFRGWPARTYNTLFKAAEEAGISRIYGGIHYQPSIDRGLVMAKEIGERVGGLNLD